ncbi:hypothetical protein BD779DRAFT_1799950 [Infundibulicybe gibba]|nr:hypothetical protein BD779DRAFT_1799950 [Infundibulicybe gibba]
MLFSDLQPFTDWSPPKPHGSHTLSDMGLQLHYHYPLTIGPALYSSRLSENAPCLSDLNLSPDSRLQSQSSALSLQSPIRTSTRPRSPLTPFRAHSTHIGTPTYPGSHFAISPLFIHGLNCTPLGYSYELGLDDWMPLDSSVSPVVREAVAARIPTSVALCSQGPHASSFADRLRTTVGSPPLPHSSQETPSGPVQPLLSPCKSHLIHTTSPAESISTKPSTPTHSLLDSVSLLSPLTPVTPEQTSPPVIESKPANERIFIHLAPNPGKHLRKRKLSMPESPTPLPSQKRARYSLRSLPASIDENEVMPKPSTEDIVALDSLPVPSSPKPTSHSPPVYSTRSFRPSPLGPIEISSNFPLFYRRYPASAYFQPPAHDSPCTLFGVRHPGGIYNPPRSALDLYTPRFVKGKGSEKVGLCPMCVEPAHRGGEDKKVWLAMKFSAFNYHMQYAHGVSASTARPFSPPIAFRTIDRPGAGKKERSRIQQGSVISVINGWLWRE